MSKARKRQKPASGRNTHVTPPRADQQLFTDERGLERIIFFSDAVFAIAITLLALEIRLPANTESTTLPAALLAIWRDYLAFVVSFLVIGLYWMGHHRTFRNVEKYTDRLMLLNLLFLLAVAFVPFPTAVLSEYESQAGVILYAATMTVVGIMSAIVWVYTRANGRFLAAPLEPAVYRRSLLRVLFVPAVFAISIPIALWNTEVAQLAWLLLMLGYLPR